jgi:hypothetical protein
VFGDWWAQATLLAAFLLVVPVVQGQQSAPHLGYVYPAGGRQGTAFQVKIGALWTV